MPPIGKYEIETNGQRHDDKKQCPQHRRDVSRTCTKVVGNYPKRRIADCICQGIAILQCIYRVGDNRLLHTVYRIYFYRLEILPSRMSGAASARNDEVKYLYEHKDNGIGDEGKDIQKAGNSSPFYGLLTMFY